MKQKISRVPFSAALCVALLLTLVMLPGCGPSGPERFHVGGSVTFDGQPVKQGLINFRPIEGTKAPLIGGIVTEGQYEIPADKGPLAGTYKVQIEVHKFTGRKMPDMAGRLVVDEFIDIAPKKYSGETSELRVEIHAGSTEHDFKLEAE